MAWRAGAGVNEWRPRGWLGRGRGGLGPGPASATAGSVAAEGLIWASDKVGLKASVGDAMTSFARLADGHRAGASRMTRRAARQASMALWASRRRSVAQLTSMRRGSVGSHRENKSANTEKTPKSKYGYTSPE